MSEHKATVTWTRTSEEFLQGKFSREHTWAFDGGVTVPASSAPTSVPVPYSNPANVDPEEAFVAAISSCHMLFFLFFASRRGVQVDSYHDDAVGVMTKNEKGRSWISSVTLRPRVIYSGDKLPTAADEEQLHHDAHDHCFVANSAKSEIIVAPVREESGAVA